MDPDRHTPPRTGQDVPDAALFWRWAVRAGRPAVGWILVGAGALAILIGYFGLADRVLVAEQLPYLISGGIGGIALVIVGGVILATNDGRREADRLDDIEDEIAELRALVVDLHRALLRRHELRRAGAALAGVSHQQPAHLRRHDSPRPARHDDRAGRVGRRRDACGRT